MRVTRRRGRAATAALAALLVAAPAGVAAQDGRAMFRGDPTHRGEVSTRGVESLGAIRWSFHTEGPVRSSPTLLDGTLYFGSVDGGLYTVRASDGAPAWHFEAAAAVIATPAVDARRVYFVDRRQRVYALDRETGRAVWVVPTGPDLSLPWGHEGWDYFASSPTLVADLVIVGGGDGNVYALEADSGRERWRYVTGARIRSTPAVADGVVYVGSGDGIVHAIDLADGSGRWRFATRGHELDADSVGFDRRQIYSSPAVVDGVVYVGSRDARLYALDAADGSERWSVDDGTTGWVIASPAVSADRVFSARSSSQRVRALDRKTGAEIWSHQAGSFVFASPVLVGGVLYVADGAGAVMALDAADGRELWRYRPGGGVQSTPLVDDGRIYVGTDDGSVYALEHGDGPTPRLAVYFDEGLRERSAFGKAPAHAQLADHFAAAGYRRLDAESLSGFLEERIADPVPSVLVFGMDAVPDEVVSGGETSLLRGYLDAGGKVVWPSPYPPDIFDRDDQGSLVGFDRARAGRLLGVDLSGWNGDRYQARPTAVGRRWGLRAPWIGSPLAAAGAVETVLAVDELGRPMAWARSYGGPPGTGFVIVHPSTQRERLDEIRRVAEYGVLRFPAAEGAPANDRRPTG